MTPLRGAAPDYAKTQSLKAHLRRLRRQRNPFELGTEDLEPIFHWKLGSQFGRSQRLLEENPDQAYRAVTRAVFDVQDGGSDYEAKVRLRLLCSLSGVGVPVASAVLALVDPKHYCVIDFRGWRAVFGGGKKSGFSVPEYIRYRRVMANLACELGWSVQETDLAVWEYDRRCGGRAA